jgi:hypothetical protein
VSEVDRVGQPALRSESEDEVRPLETLPVDTLWRVALGLLGGALLGVSCLSVLTKDNELGTTALAVIGAFLLMISALGQWPARLVWGDKMAEWGARRVRRVMESGAGPRAVARVAADEARTPLEQLLAFQLHREARSRHGFETEALDRLAELADLLGFTMIIRELAGVWDARLMRAETAGPGGAGLNQSVVVLCSRDRPIAEGKTLSLMARLQAIAMRGERPSAVLIITEYSADREDADYLASAIGEDKDTPVFISQLDADDFNEVVREAVSTLA